MSANINKENAGIIKNDTILCHTSPCVVAQNIGWVQILIRKMLGPPKMTTLCHNSINKVFNLDEQINLMSQVQSFIDLVWNENRNISTCFIMKIMGLMKKITPLSFFAWFKWVSIWVWEACYCWRFVDLQKPARSSEIVHEKSKSFVDDMMFMNQPLCPSLLDFD